MPSLIDVIQYFSACIANPSRLQLVSRFTLPKQSRFM